MERADDTGNKSQLDMTSGARIDANTLDAFYLPPIFLIGNVAADMRRRW